MPSLEDWAFSLNFFHGFMDTWNHVSIAPSNKFVQDVFMARKNPIPEREIQIGKRLREYRLSIDLSQVAFAKRMGIDSSLLATYEHARAPLKFDLAEKFCESFNVSQRWLAIGKLPKDYYVDFYTYVNLEIDPKDLFSAVYDELLSERIDDYFETLSRLLFCKEEDINSQILLRSPGYKNLNMPWKNLYRTLPMDDSILKTELEEGDYRSLWNKTIPTPDTKAIDATPHKPLIKDLYREMLCESLDLPLDCSEAQLAKAHGQFMVRLEKIKKNQKPNSTTDAAVNREMRIDAALQAAGVKTKTRKTVDKSKTKP